MFTSAVWMSPPSSSCFTVVIQVCSPLSPSFPSASLPPFCRYHSNAPARHQRLFLKTFYSHSCCWWSSDWPVTSLSHRTVDLFVFFFLCCFVFPTIHNKGDFRPTSSCSHTLWAGGGRSDQPIPSIQTIQNTPYPNCWEEQMQHASEVHVDVSAVVGTKATTWMWQHQSFKASYLPALLFYKWQQFRERASNPAMGSTQAKCREFRANEPAGAVSLELWS